MDALSKEVKKGDGQTTVTDLLNENISWYTNIFYFKNIKPINPYW